MFQSKSTILVLGILCAVIGEGVRYGIDSRMHNHASYYSRSLGLTNRSGCIVQSLHIEVGKEKFDFIDMYPGFTSLRMFGFGKVNGSISGKLTNGQPISSVKFETSLDHRNPGEIVILPGGYTDFLGDMRAISE